MFEKEQNQTVTVTLFALINEYLSANSYRRLRAADYTKILSEIERGNEVAIETLIEATSANTSVPIRLELPDGSLRSFLTDYHGEKAILLSRNKVLRWPRSWPSQPALLFLDRHKGCMRTQQRSAYASASGGRPEQQHPADVRWPNRGVCRRQET